ncbi:hypothetical protein SCMU_32080 [Sinomonas cyclohexanicum]|uniref:Uncharacterized protein n=1 Tax=Sinomonas cyclohexanicum TaxID=322009 RepID=A0ABN6FKZ8_SINCY|nr:hypothetical protein SCMU_32080 [Corynebacterium cyclohexanicum]
MVERDEGSPPGDLEGGAGLGGVAPVQHAHDDALRWEALVQDDPEIVQSVPAVPDGDGHARGQRGAGGPRKRLSSVAVMPARVAVVATRPAAPRRSTRGTTMPSVTSWAKRSANFSAGHGVGGLVCGVRK